MRMTPDPFTVCGKGQLATLVIHMYSNLIQHINVYIHLWHHIIHYWMLHIRHYQTRYNNWTPLLSWPLYYLHNLNWRYAAEMLIHHSQRLMDTILLSFSQCTNNYRRWLPYKAAVKHAFKGTYCYKFHLKVYLQCIIYAELQRNFAFQQSQLNTLYQT